jgi:hypothetical protein
VGTRWGEHTGLDAAVEAEPDVLVVGRPSATPDGLGRYRLARVFDGHRFWKTGILKTDRLAVYVCDSSPTSKRAAPAP